MAHCVGAWHAHGMARRYRSSSGASLLVLGALLASCSMLQGLVASEAASAEPGATASNRTARPTAFAETSSQPPPGTSVVASPPIAVPDPVNPTVHQVGDAFQVPGAVVEYQGVVATGAQLVVRFRVTNGALAAGAGVLATDGSLLPLPGGFGTLETAPFGNAASPPAPDETMTLMVGDRLYVLAVGSVG
jgi:hypothetical protein